jgi:hypothetical protein
MTAKEFLLKKFPTNKYWDCPVPKHHWDIMEEYAKAYHEQQVKLLATPAVSVERKPVRKRAVCRKCGSDDISFDMDAGTWICDACNQKAN